VVWTGPLKLLCTYYGAMGCKFVVLVELVILHILPIAWYCFIIGVVHVNLVTQIQGKTVAFLISDG